MIELVMHGVRALVDPDRGGRLSSLRIDGVEILDQSVAPEGQPPGFYGGSFPMAPFAGFIPEPRLRELGATMAINVPGGASHGLVYERAWDVDSATKSVATLRCQINDGWLAAVEAQQYVELTDDALHMRLSLRTDQAVPAALGFHPWFRRDLGNGPVEVIIHPEHIRGFDDTGLASEFLDEPPRHPWDHFLAGVRTPPVLRWPELELSLEADTSSWIVYETPHHAVCIEPVTAAPNEVLAGVARALPERALSLELTLRWVRRTAPLDMQLPETS